MLQQERTADLMVALQNVLRGWQRSMYTALPGIVLDDSPVVAADGTISVQPSIRGRMRAPNGTETDVTLPKLIKVPLVWPSGGGFSMTFPIAAGDEVLVVFGSRCIDGWWQSGGVQSQIELRMQHLSDGFAIPGPRSVPRAIGAVSSVAVQLRSDDGACYVEVAPGHKVNVIAPGDVTVTGNLHVTGAIIAGYGSAGQVGLQTHTHSQGADSHGDSEVETNAPTAGT